MECKTAGRLGGGPDLGVCWGQGTRWGPGVGRMIQQQPHFCSRPFGSPLLASEVDVEDPSKESSTAMRPMLSTYSGSRQDGLGILATVDGR